MPIFRYHQNNSGGRFTGPAINVDIEAPSTNVANAKAEDMGVYFDGCRSGRDCPCCGDRWSEAYSWDEVTEPMEFPSWPELYTHSGRDEIPFWIDVDGNSWFIDIKAKKLVKK